MSSTVVNIETKEFITVKTSNKVSIFVKQIVLFQKAEIHVHFLDEYGSCISVEILYMDGTNYTSWGENDQYVIDWTLNQLGLSPTTQVVF
jgi:hypothetical protein